MGWENSTQPEQHDRAEHVPSGSPVPRRVPLRDISLATAASESDIRVHASSRREARARSVVEVPTDRTLEMYLGRVSFYSVVGSTFLLIIAISSGFGGSFGTMIGYMLLAITAGVSGFFGSKHHSWQLLLLFFLTTFVLLTILVARVVLTIVVLASRAKLSDEELFERGFGYRGWMVASGVVEIIMLILFAVFWGLVAHSAERAVRILTSQAFAGRDPELSGPQTVSVVVVGRDSAYGLPTAPAAATGAAAGAAPEGREGRLPDSYRVAPDGAGDEGAGLAVVDSGKLDEFERRPTGTD